MSNRLTVGAFQFAGSGDIARNVAALERGLKRAARHRVRLLLTQECALCGYPPVEVPSTSLIDRKAQAVAVEEISQLARKYGMYVALGMITFHNNTVSNTIRLVCPDGRSRQPYHKRALYGWDAASFTPGNATGIYRVDGIRVGVRICYEIRFPEYFRELFRRRVQLALVAFADGANAKLKMNVLRSHLVSRAAENAMYVLSANSISRPQAAPSCFIDPDGRVLDAAPPDREALIVGDIAIEEPDFSRRGRIVRSRFLCRRG